LPRELIDRNLYASPNGGGGVFTSVSASQLSAPAVPPRLGAPRRRRFITEPQRVRQPIAALNPRQRTLRPHEAAAVRFYDAAAHEASIRL